MKSFQFCLGTRKQNRIACFAASAVATLAIAAPISSAIAGSINYASANPIKITTAKEITSASVQLSPTKPNIAQLQTNQIQYQAAGIDP